jgi:hypothetical protein
MKWPRGRYNGQRIGGIRIVAELNLCWWTWYVARSGRSLMVHLGPIHLWIEPSWER